MSDVAFMIATALIVAMGVALRLSAPRGGSPSAPAPQGGPAE